MPIRPTVRRVLPIAVMASLLATASASSISAQTAKAKPKDSATRKPAAAQSLAREQTADQQVQHVLNRLAFGPRPGDVETVRAIGVDRWIAMQLEPGKIDDHDTDGFIAQFKTLGMTGEQLLAEYPPPGAQLAKLARERQAAARANGGDGGNAMNITADDSAKLRAQGRQSYAFLGEIATSRVARAAISERQLQEVMVDFWENHFNVFAGKDRTRYFLSEYDAVAIRPNALGKFRDLLGAVAKSPAMLYYLDNWQSVADSGQPTLGQPRRQVAAGNGLLGGRIARGRNANVTLGELIDRGAIPAQQMRRLQQLPPAALAEVRKLTPAEAQQRIAQIAATLPNANRKRGLNENYARELMELHTLGVDGGYTQTDVINVARALTGWTLARGANGGDFLFRPETHDAGAKTILGQPFPAGRGVEEGEAVLDLLARHPNTARFIATKLARRFVSDTPPAALVARAAATFTRTDGDISETLRTIITSPEFFAASTYRAKVKSPFELVVSTLRVMDAKADASPRTTMLVSRLGQPIFGHQAPNGYPETGEAWMNTGSILNRINFGLAVAAGRVPGVRVADWPATQRLASLTREAQVDGVIREMFGGAVSSDTRQVLITGTNPFLESRAAQAKAGDSLLVDDDAMNSMNGSTMNGNATNDAAAGKATRQANATRARARAAAKPPAIGSAAANRQQSAAGREAVRPGAGATLTQAIGNLPNLTGFAQIVGLAIGAPEFQRR